MTDLRKIYIVIPVYNKIDYTISCLRSLKMQNYSHFEVIVVDDGSSDGTSEIINDRFPEVTVLQGTGNLWWTGGINMGVEYALNQAEKSDFILTLNNDLEVDSNYLKELLRIYDQQKPCLVGSVSVNINNPEKVEFFGIKCNYISSRGKPPVPGQLSYTELVKNHEFFESDVLPGRGTLIPVHVFNEIGLFDIKYFPHYLADHDFSLRARKAGYKSVVASKAIVKSIVESTGISYKVNPTLSTFFHSLISIKSPNRLKTKYYWAMRHSPIRILYFFKVVIRIFLSFLRVYIQSFFKLNNRITVK